jgi:hypothetical protein
MRKQALQVGKGDISGQFHLLIMIVFQHTLLESGIYYIGVKPVAVDCFAHGHCIPERLGHSLPP